MNQTKIENDKINCNNCLFSSFTEILHFTSIMCNFYKKTIEVYPKDNKNINPKPDFCKVESILINEKEIK